MIYLCQPNRVRRTYLGGSRIDRLYQSYRPNQSNRLYQSYRSSQPDQLNQSNPQNQLNQSYQAFQSDNTPHDGYFPEEWVASITPAYSAERVDREGISRLTDGRDLRELISSTPELVGISKNGDIDAAYPILLKLLDAAERLVIQAHPTAEFAREHLSSDFGKAECWYVVSADPGAHIYLGFQEGITRSDWVRAFETQDSEYMLSLLHRLELHEGDVWYVDGGVPHAIGGGCLLAELQEPSDLMVVMERCTPTGRPIPDSRIDCGLGAHMFDVYDYTGYTRDELRRKYYRRPEPRPNEFCTLVGAELTDKFRLYRCDVMTHDVTIDGAMTHSVMTDNIPVTAHNQSRIPVWSRQVPAALTVVCGHGKAYCSDGEFELHAGDCAFIPANSGEIRFIGDMRVLIASGTALGKYNVN